MRAVAAAYALALVFALTMFPLAGQAQTATLPPVPHLDEHAFVAPPRSSAILAGNDTLRGPSQFMAGTVAVRLVLPESDGSLDRSSEDWTPTQIEAVRSQVQQALDWWTAQLPLARLRFELRVEVVPTAYEPITHGLSDEDRWIGDVLGRLGFPGTNHFDQAYAAADDLRDELGADWATVIIVANSANHSSGYFADGRFAYAYINGPFLVLTSRVGAYGADHMAPVAAHELGHTFGALDQYSAARIDCTRRSGYLDAPTDNSQYSGCGTTLPSIMLEPMGAFAAGQIDASALAQLGYHDSDADRLIDPLDTTPSLELQASTLASGSGRPVIHGSTRDLAFPSTYHQDVTLNTISAVEYRIDGGHWITTTPADGAFDSALEGFSAELPLYDGSYALELRALNSAGASSGLTAQQVDVTWIGPQPRYSLSTPAASATAQLHLQLEAPATTQAVEVSESTSFDGATWQPYAPEIVYSLGGSDGPRSIYVRFRDQFGLVSLPYLARTSFDTLPPQGSAMRLPAEPALLLLDASDTGSSVTDVEVTVDAGAPLWMPYARSIQLDGMTATQRVTVRFRDAAGNRSRSLAALVGYQIALPLIAR